MPKENKNASAPETAKTENAALGVNSEIGASGTKLFGGNIYEEYNPKLSGTAGLAKYDEMRKSDAQVQATLLAMELPIRGTHWYVEPGETVGEGGETEITDEDRAIAEFVEDALFRRMDQTWDDFLRQALTMLPFGFSVFEKVYKEEGGKIYVERLAQRLARTVWEWKWNPETRKRDIVQQIEGNDEGKPFTVTIPAGKCLVFSYRREGDNFAGVPVLRSAYKHWYIKDQLYKFEAVKHERQAVGVPILTLPDGATDADKTEAVAILQNLRASEQGYVVLPSQAWKFEFANMGSGTTSDVKDAIAHHNREISKNILAQFLELGSAGASGSYSLSQDQSGIFMLSITSIARQIAETVNRELVPQLVELNFDVPDNRNFPTLKFSKLGDVDYSELATSLATLASAGLIVPDEETEEHVRKVFDLPKKAEQEEGAEDGEEIPEDDAEDLGEMADEAEADESAPDSGDDAADSEKELAALEGELSKLEASETYASAVQFSEACGFSETDTEAAVFRAPVSDEARRNISEALKEYWKRKGKKTSQAVAETGGRHEAIAESAKADMAKRSDDFKKSVAPLKSKLEEIRKLKDKLVPGKRDQETRAKIAAMARAVQSEIRSMRSVRDAAVAEARTVRANAVKSAKAAKAELAERKKALDSVVKKVKADADAKNATRAESIRILATQAKANAAAVKDVLAKAKAEAAGKSSAAKKEIMKNARSIVEGIRSQSEGLRETARKLRDDAAKERKSAGDKTAAIREASAVKAHEIGDDAARALGFSDVTEMRYFLEAKKTLDSTVVLNVQNRA